MKKVIAIVWILLTSSAVFAKCSGGVERWGIKTLADSPVLNGKPLDTTVDALIRLSVPSPKLLARNSPVEFQVYSITAKLIGYKGPETDGDLHIVVADTVSGKTMIVEVPSSECAPTKELASVFQAIRVAIQKAIPTRIKSHGLYRPKKGITAKFTGVGFFDYQHQQVGVASNAIELHPILSFTIVQ